MNKRRLGSLREGEAAAFLESQGFRILEKNFRCRLGEIDLIARDGPCLVFVEVKYRRSDRYGWGEEHVDKRKQQRIIAVARYFLAGFKALPPCRFDVIAIDKDSINHFPNAFEVK